MKTLCRLLFLVVAVTMASCSHKDIMCPSSGSRLVTVVFDWAKAPDAAPEGMTLYFFPLTDRESIWRFDIAGRDGGPVEIPTGRYCMIACNNDLPQVSFSGTGAYDTFKAVPRQYRPGDKTVASVGMLYGATVEYLDVTLCGVSYSTGGNALKECGKSIIKCCPDSLSTIFSVYVRDVDRIERVRSASACIRNVSTAMTVANGTASGDRVGLTMPLRIESGEKMLIGSAGAFTNLERDASYSLTLTVTLTNGKSLAKEYDVTRQVMSAPSDHHVIILIDSPDIPDGDIPDNPDNPDGDVGGIDVGVDGWTVIEIEMES